MQPLQTKNETYHTCDWLERMAANNHNRGRNMNEVNTTLREINVTIAYYKRKIKSCEEAIQELEKHKKEIMKKYDLPIK